MITEYAGKKAVVTGAASGIGEALAVGMAERGADLLLVDIRGEALEPVAEKCRSFGRDVYTMQADVSLEDECQKIFDRTMELFGRCDILVNNAGVSSGGSITTIPPRDIYWVYETNVYSHWYMMRRFIPQMEAQGDRCEILNVCSIAGLVTLANSPVYFSSKHAAVALSESVWKTLKQKGSNVDIQIFCPGFIQTNLWDADAYRPERYAVEGSDDPYYTSEEFKQYPVRIKYTLDNSYPLQPTIDKVFEMLGKDQFFILTHDEFDGLLRGQGVFQADMVQPIDPSLFAK